MDTTLAIMAISFIVLLLINVPVSVCIGLSTLLSILYVMYFTRGFSASDSVEGSLWIIAQRMATGIDSFSLLAIPFFILAGSFMGKGGIARRLIDFAAALVGRFTGGLAYVNVLTCMLFGATPRRASSPAARNTAAVDAAALSRRLPSVPRPSDRWWRARAPGRARPSS